jgi:hypothetical protein
MAPTASLIVTSLPEEGIEVRERSVPTRTLPLPDWERGLKKNII